MTKIYKYANAFLNVALVVGFFVLINMHLDANAQSHRPFYDLRPDCENSPAKLSFKSHMKKSDENGLEYYIVDMASAETVKATKLVWVKSGFNVPDEFNLFAVVVMESNQIAIRMKKIGDYQAVCFVLPITKQELESIVGKKA